MLFCTLYILLSDIKKKRREEKRREEKRREEKRREEKRREEKRREEKWSGVNERQAAVKEADLNTASSSSQGMFVAAIIRILSSAEVVAPSTCVMNSVLRRLEASCSFSCDIYRTDIG